VNRAANINSILHPPNFFVKNSAILLQCLNYQSVQFDFLLCLQAPTHLQQGDFGQFALHFSG
jgi:hypothetical protein